MSMLSMCAGVSLCVVCLVGCSSSSGTAKVGGGDTGGASTAGSGGDNGSSTAGGGTAGSTGGGTAGTGTAGSGDSGTPPACDASKAPDVGKLGLERVVGGVEDLVYAAQPPGSSDWYLVRQSGRIDVFTAGAVRSTAFLDITSDGTLGGSGGDERGLLGLAFHPDYAANGLFYVAITPPSQVDQVREYKRSDADPYRANLASKRDIVVLPASASNHNGGTVRFGPDGMLYVGTGDGGGGCTSDKTGAPQDIGSPFGKILRLDVAKSAPFAADGNPFAGDGDARVFHYGLRNPFRFGFDRLTGDLYIGDVGQDDFEDLDFAPKGSKGLNFGWPAYEGRVAGTCPDWAGPLRPGAKHTPPIFVADRRGNTTPNFSDWKSVIGGVVYRGTALPKLQGVYIFGDYLGARLGALVQCGSKTSAVTPVRKSCDLNNPAEACFNAKGGADNLSALPAIVEGNDGELYFVANRNALYKVVAN